MDRKRQTQTCDQSTFVRFPNKHQGEITLLWTWGEKLYGQIPRQDTSYLYGLGGLSGRSVENMLAQQPRLVSLSQMLHFQKEEISKGSIFIAVENKVG